VLFVQGIVRLVVFAILLATAGAVTKLMAMNMEATRTVVWDNASMDGMINLDTRVGDQRDQRHCSTGLTTLCNVVLNRPGLVTVASGTRCQVQGFCRPQRTAWHACSGRTMRSIHSSSHPVWWSIICMCVHSLPTGVPPQHH